MELKVVLKIIRLVFLTGIFAVLSCQRTDPLVEADLTLDDLEDKTDYSSEMLVDGRFYNGRKTSKVVIDYELIEDPELLELNAGYHRIEIYTENSNKIQELIRIAILDEHRGEAEWGLPPWTPSGVEIGTISDQQITMIYPRNIPEGYDLPLVVVIGEQLANSSDNFLARAGSHSFLLKRGVGSAWIPANVNELMIDHLTYPVQKEIFSSSPGSLSGTIDQDTVIAAGSYLHVSADLQIASGVNLTIEEGTFITVDPEVNIYNGGWIRITGSATAPVCITCSENGSYWGGFISSGSGTGVEASHAIFARSGYHAGEEYNWGHASRQALFYNERGSITTDHCYMIDHIGQVFYPLHATVEITNCLIQRAKTGGQINHSDLLISHSVFTDFPDDSDTYQDEDNDGLYIHDCDANIMHSVFMYAKDDGLDSGASPGGEITISHTRFESNFHEGAALSSGRDVIKNHYLKHCLFMDNGQGLELGYSSLDHHVYADSCKFIRNGIGIRYGDCYEWYHKGTMHITNSESIDNVTADVWNMVRENWSASVSHMVFDNVAVSKAYPLYPELIIQENNE
jgi:hypothetical protein